MMGLRAWFAARSLRERRLLLVALALALVTLLWAGIVLPVRDALSSTRERHASAVDRLGTTMTRVDRLQTVRRRPPLTGDLLEILRSEAADAGFALATVDRQGTDRVRATIQSARPGALAGWLARLEARGILIDSATLTDHGDRTVGAVLVLKARVA
ncbi:type II secretion system protein GspM [Sphingomonas sp.]|jgi:general secretion pathway protein M|uniref:type II secretion system protein GspM n=1 Tax=Sphingomonas sp. TaxID=28214 RepID=UPI002ED84D23